MAKLRRRKFERRRHLLPLTLFVLLALCSVLFVVFTSSHFPTRPFTSPLYRPFLREGATKALKPSSHPQPVVLLSVPEQVRFIHTDVRGNLGPPEVLLNNGTDWLHDRWQAASDMHGTEIKGQHWVAVQFRQTVRVTDVQLDWETAYSDDYVIRGQTSANATVWTVDSQHKPTIQRYRTVHEMGVSPGVKNQKLPLHIVHNYHNLTTEPIQQLQILIRSPFHKGWGVSLWSVQVYGYYVSLD